MSRLVALGIDPGLRETGWSIVEGASRYSVLCCGAWLTPKGTPLDEAIDTMCGHLLELLGNVDVPRPDFAAIEDYCYQGKASHNANAFELSRLVGELRRTALAAGLEVLLASKGEINRRVVGSGKTPKRRVAAVLRGAVVGDPGSNEHKRDATAAGVGGILVWRRRGVMRGANR